MEKAYDIKALAEKLKGKGLDVAEDMAGHVYVAVKEWAKESAALSANKFDDLAAPFYDQLDAIVLPQIDKIDNKQG
jgi:hypothetical protein